jgi:hypothetical protein
LTGRALFFCIFVEETSQLYFIGTVIFTHNINMTTKTTNIFLSVLFAICIAPACSRAQYMIPSDFAPSSEISVSASPLPMPPPETTDIVTAPNAIYLELLGSGFLYSINYDRTLMNMFAVRVGFGYFPFPPITETNNAGVTSTINASLTSIPITFSWFPFSSSTSAPSSKLEIGAGATYINLVAKKVGKSETGSGMNYSGILGYRYQPSDGGFLFKVAFTPIFSSPIFTKFQPWGGITLGYAF